MICTDENGDQHNIGTVPLIVNCFACVAFGLWVRQCLIKILLKVLPLQQQFCQPVYLEETSMSANSRQIIINYGA